MAESLFTADTYSMVRSALNAGLDETSLPNEMIDLSIYGPAAVAWVQGQDIFAVTYTQATNPVKLQNARNAVAFYIASIISNQVPRVVSEQFGDYRYQIEAFNANEQAELMLEFANNFIAMNIEPDGKLPPLICFTTVGGLRGR